VDTGRLTRESLYAELGEIVSGAKTGRETDEERILFWHRGLSILDVALAHLILTRALASDVGTMLRYR
jgi:ornithine cyclodeaminase